MSSTFPYTYEERLLTVDNISVKYDDRQILNGVSFKIDNVVRPNMLQGQVVSLLGPSGMGKTQLFRCISGLQHPTTGYVKLANDKEVDAGDVGVVMQHYPLLQHRTVLGNLLLVNSDKQKSLELLRRFGLEDKKDMYPCQLSGGQRQRVAIIQQLLCSTEYLLMDEPFSGLDPIAKMEVMNLIREVSIMDELYTIIIITHDIEASLMISDHVLLLGRDRDVNGNIIPGAKIQREIDLIERDIAWHDDIEKRLNYLTTLKEIKDAFLHL